MKSRVRRYPHLDWLRERRPNDAEVRFLTARLRRNLGQPEEAGQLLDALLVSTPKKVPVLVERGRVAMDLKRPRDAEGWLHDALTLAPDNREVNIAMADCFTPRQANWTRRKRLFRTRPRKSRRNKAKNWRR